MSDGDENGFPRLILIRAFGATGIPDGLVGDTAPTLPTSPPERGLDEPFL